VPQVGRPFERRHLVDHHLRLRATDRRDHSALVEAVHHGRMCAGLPQLLGLLLRTRRRDDVVASVDQARYEPLADHASAACKEDFHLGSSRSRWGSLPAEARASASRSSDFLFARRTTTRVNGPVRRSTAGVLCQASSNVTLVAPVGSSSSR
jgi:hypothetical protein